VRHWAHERALERAQSAARAADVWAATYVLLGLRYSDEFAHALFEEVLGMEESATYQAIVRGAEPRKGAGCWCSWVKPSLVRAMRRRV